MVTAYEGANLLAPGAGPRTVMLRFWRQGRLLSQVRLDQLVAHPERMPAAPHRRPERKRDPAIAPLRRL
jgi:hypothetical protein